MRCKGDTVEGEAVVNLQGDQPMLWDYITMLRRNRNAYKDELGLKRTANSSNLL